MRALQFYLVAIAFLLSLVAAFDLKGQIDLGLKLDNPKVEVPKAPAETRRNVYNSVLRFPDGTGGNRNVMDVLDGATTDDKRRQLVRPSPHAPPVSDHHRRAKMSNGLGRDCSRCVLADDSIRFLQSVEEKGTQRVSCKYPDGAFRAFEARLQDSSLHAISHALDPPSLT